MNGETNAHASFWLRGYTADGYQIGLTLPIENIQHMLSLIQEIREAGILPREQGVNEGEQVERMTHVLRITHVDRQTGEITPRIYFYPENMSWKRTSVYLNTPNDIADFEKACGVALAKLPIWEGGSSFERGVNQIQDKYVIALPTPVSIVWKLNPAYDENKKPQTKEKHLFVRYHNLAPSLNSVPNSSAAPTAVQTQAQTENAPKTLETTLVSLTVQAEDKKPRLVFKTKEGLKAYAFTRQLFIGAGWIGEDEWTIAGMYNFTEPIPVVITQNARGFWDVTHVTAHELTQDIPF